MAKVFILVALSTLILLIGCNSSNNSSETAPPQFIFQQSATPLEVIVTPSVIMPGQSANITIRTTPNAFVWIRIVSPDEELLLKKLKYLETTETADMNGLFTGHFNTLIFAGPPVINTGPSPVFPDESTKQWSVPGTGYYRVIAAAESGVESRMGTLWGHSGNVTIVITSFLVR